MNLRTIQLYYGICNAGGSEGDEIPAFLCLTAILFLAYALEPGQQRAGNRVAAGVLMEEWAAALGGAG